MPQAVKVTEIYLLENKDELKKQWDSMLLDMDHAMELPKNLKPSLQKQWDVFTGIWTGSICMDYLEADKSHGILSG